MNSKEITRRFGPNRKAKRKAFDPEAYRKKLEREAGKLGELSASLGRLKTYILPETTTSILEAMAEQ